MAHNNVSPAAHPVSVSPAVVKRLPRYYRYLRELITQGKMRISSNELSVMMNVTASQIRQDLNCFGGFGQQGYGYNVNYLFARISEILGVGAGYHAIIVGAGDLGRGLVHQSMFEKRGVDILAMFDTGEGLVGQTVADIDVLPLESLEEFCASCQVDIAVITCPKEQVRDVAARLVACKVKGLWNYMGVELGYSPQEVVVENVHLGDSLMILNYKIASRFGTLSEEERGELASSEDSITDLPDSRTPETV
jgi:redox-sensing transcriptional repressor